MNTKYDIRIKKFSKGKTAKKTTVSFTSNQWNALKQLEDITGQDFSSLIDQALEGFLCAAVEGGLLKNPDEPISSEVAPSVSQLKVLGQK